MDVERLWNLIFRDQLVILEYRHEKLHNLDCKEARAFTPLTVRLQFVLKGKKICKIDGGIFSGLYFSQSKKYLMTKEYSGSCGENRIIDVNNCKVHSVKADYCGRAETEVTKVLVRQCVGQSIRILNRRKNLGIELPFDKGVNISNPRTLKAKIVK